MFDTASGPLPGDVMFFYDGNHLLDEIIDQQALMSCVMSSWALIVSVWIFIWYQGSYWNKFGSLYNWFVPRDPNAESTNSNILKKKKKVNLNSAKRLAFFYNL